MTKPIYCPMSFGNPSFAKSYVYTGTRIEPMECTPECAWAVSDGSGTYGCVIALGEFNMDTTYNKRPLPEVEDGFCACGERA